MSPRLTLSILPLNLAVVQLPADAPLPKLSGAFFSLTGTADELSLVCEETLVPADAKAEGGWVAFKLHGPFAFTLTGILAAVLNPLRDAGIGIFAISTFDTDYVLIKREHLPQALQVFTAVGHTVQGG